MRTFLLFINVFAVPLLLCVFAGFTGIVYFMVAIFALIAFGGQTTDKK